MAVVTMRFPARFFAWAAPRIAMLSLSVPPEVKYTSFGWAERRCARISRAAVISRSAAKPLLCSEEGLP